MESTTEKAPEIDAEAVAQALLMMDPDAIESEVRPIAPELADCIQAHRSAAAIKQAQRTVEDTIRTVNAERTRLLLKDQLRMLLRLEDRDFIRLAAAEMLSREPASNRTITYANGDVGDIGYDETGTVYASIVNPGGKWDYWVPEPGKA